MPCWRPLPGIIRLARPSRSRSLLSIGGGRCFATENTWTENRGRVAVTASLVVAGVGGAAWAVAPWFWDQEALMTQTSRSDPSLPAIEGTLMPVSDEIFDTSDNLFVFFLDHPEEVLDRREDIERVMRPLLSDGRLRRLRFFHNVRKEGDPVVPEAPAAEGKEVPAKPLKVVMYKGQRKTIVNIGAEVPLQQILDFYTPVSEEIPGSANKNRAVEHVSGKSFHAEVVKKSSPERWVLLQMFEDTCFLCFLMRPFVNSVAVLLAEQGMPITIKRLNVEKNDFPDGCPVARGTPTFVLFRGPQAAPNKWDEFKPKDFVDKLAKEFPSMDESVYKKMEDYQELVSQRFRLFTQLVFWTVELSKIQVLVSAPPGTPAPREDGEKKEETAFNTVVSQMMVRDMKRTDGIQDNLKHLQREVDEVEHDCAVLGLMLGESILERESQGAAA